jgi:hypothetical protein
MRLRNLGSLGLLLAGLVAVPGASHAQGLDVKPGLWEIKMTGTQIVQKVCYTAEFLKQDFSKVPTPPGLQCKHEIKQANARLVISHTVCTGNFSLDGETRMEATNKETMVMVSKSKLNMGGKMQETNVTASYKWLGADCGKVKPFDLKNLPR